MSSCPQLLSAFQIRLIQRPVSEAGVGGPSWDNGRQRQTSVTETRREDKAENTLAPL